MNQANEWDDLRLALEVQTKEQAELERQAGEILGEVNPFADPDPYTMSDPRVKALEIESDIVSRRIARLKASLSSEPADLYLEWYRSELDKQDVDEIDTETAFKERWKTLDYADYRNLLPTLTAADLDREMLMDGRMSA